LFKDHSEIEHPIYRQRTTEQELNGVIQHSFALRVVQAHAPFQGPGNLDQIRERFSLSAGESGDEFGVNQVGVEEGTAAVSDSASHSPLVAKKKTSIGVRELSRLGPAPKGDLTGEFPDALSWAGGSAVKGCDAYEEPRLVLVGEFGRDTESACNDFLVARRNSSGESECDAAEISTVLLEVIAHKRSRLFGLALGRRFINVMLPHAILRGTGSQATWLLQPLVTLIRDAQNINEFRSTYSLSIFLVPVKVARSKLTKRRMSRQELKWMVDAGWGLATSPPAGVPPSFELEGPLPGYLSRLVHPDLDGLMGPLSVPGRQKAGATRGRDAEVTLRGATEAVAFGVGLRIAQGSGTIATEKTKREIGKDAIAALGSTRVSSVVVVDDTLKKQKIRKRSKKKWTPPGKLVPLMRELSGDSHIPNTWTRAERKRYRLDRSFTDGDEAIVGVLPHSRCLVVTSAADAQCGRLESGLMQAGSVAYMTLGAATAIGMLRLIDRDLENMEGASPRKVAEVDSEIATDLNEIYDLDITRESYRIFYRRLRSRLGITGDYKTLQDKMDALYRATSTAHIERTNQLLIALTAAIVLLTLLLLLKPGG